MPTVQNLVVALIVIGCVGYAAWSLMPAAARRALAQRALRLPLPAALARPFERALRPAGACGGCDGCGDADTKVAVPRVRAITLHRRLKH